MVSEKRTQLGLTLAMGLSLVAGSATVAAGQEPSAASRQETEVDQKAAAADDQQSSAGTAREQIQAWGAAGSRVFVSPEGELTNEPEPGQVQRLLQLGRALRAERLAAAVSEQTAGAQTSSGGTSLTGVRQPTREEIINHTAPTFTTPVGIGVALDDRFLHSLKVRVAPDGTLTYFCDVGSHDHSPIAASVSEEINSGVGPSAGEVAAPAAHKMANQ